MRGDQLARQWRVIRAIEASPGGLTVAEIAKREETGIPGIYFDLEVLLAVCFHTSTNCSNSWNFRDLKKFKCLTSPSLAKSLQFKVLVPSRGERSLTMN
jgi:hypothetical protein